MDRRKGRQGRVVMRFELAGIGIQCAEATEFEYQERVDIHKQKIILAGRKKVRRSGIGRAKRLGFEGLLKGW